MASNKRVTSAKDFNNRVDETTCSWTPVSPLPQPLLLPLNGLTNKVARVTGTEEMREPSTVGFYSPEPPRLQPPLSAPLQPQGRKPRPQGDALSLSPQVGCTRARGLAACLLHGPGAPRGSASRRGLSSQQATGSRGPSPTGACPSHAPPVLRPLAPGSGEMARPAAVPCGRQGSRGPHLFSVST